MKSSFKKVIDFILPQNVVHYLRDYYVINFQKKLYREWKKKGSPVPPPHIVKQMVIKEYQQNSNYNILVETGTYKGDMLKALKEDFLKLFSIELSHELYIKAKERFKNNSKIEIIEGDSGQMLSVLLNRINEPAIFWLDGHYSGGVTAKGDKDCPIFEELDSIFNSQSINHILLIDDARLFNGMGDYPTIESLTEYVQSKNNKYKVKVEYDIIRYIVED